MAGRSERSERRAWALLTGISTRRVERRHAAWWSLGEGHRWESEGARPLTLYLEAHELAGALRRAAGWILPRERGSQS